VHTDRRNITSGQKCHSKGSRKTKIKEFTANVEKEMYGHNSRNWSHRNSKKDSKKNLKATPGTHQQIHYRRHHI
jgi:hypothetical protein